MELRTEGVGRHLELDLDGPNIARLINGGPNASFEELPVPAVNVFLHAKLLEGPVGRAIRLDHGAHLVVPSFPLTGERLVDRGETGKGAERDRGVSFDEVKEVGSVKTFGRAKTC